jgi:hypothetical protein
MRVSFLKQQVIRALGSTSFSIPGRERSQGEGVAVRHDMILVLKITARYDRKFYGWSRRRKKKDDGAVGRRRVTFDAVESSAIAAAVLVQGGESNWD